jgi:hypothetical protein
MHHPHQFNVMAKSFQDDRLRTAAASRAGKKARSQQLDWRQRLTWPSWRGGLRQAVGWAAANFRHLSIRYS